MEPLLSPYAQPLKFGLCLPDYDFYRNPVFQPLLSGIGHSLGNHVHDLRVTVQARQGSHLPATWHNMDGIVWLEYAGSDEIHAYVTRPVDDIPSRIGFSTMPVTSGLGPASTQIPNTEPSARQPAFEVGKLLGGLLLNQFSG